MAFINKLWGQEGGIRKKIFSDLKEACVYVLPILLSSPLAECTHTQVNMNMVMSGKVCVCVCVCVPASGQTGGSALPWWSA